MTDEVTDAICFDMVVAQRDAARRRIEKLEAALRDIASGRYSGIVLTSVPPQDPAINRAKQALEGKDD